MELHHLGLDPDTVPHTVVLVSAGVAGRVQVDLVPNSVVERREFRCGRLSSAPDVLVCSGARGAPATVIALEELRRAGAATMVLMTTCECATCAENAAGGHGLLVPRGARRGEGTSVSYAPEGFPAVPHHGLAQALCHTLGTADTRVVSTVDVPGRWLRDQDHRDDEQPTDLETAAVLVAAAGGGVAAASVLVGSRADPAHLMERVAAAARVDR